MKYSAHDMASIVATISIARRKAKLSNVAIKRVRDKVERINKEAADLEGQGRSSLKKNGKSKVEEVPKKKFSFSSTMERGL